MAGTTKFANSMKIESEKRRSKAASPLALLALLTAVACGPGDQEATLEITAPIGGVTLTLATDTDPDLAGVQANVDVTALRLSTGEQVQLMLDGATLLASTTVPADGLLTYENVTFPAGNHNLMASARDGALVSESINLNINDGCAAISFVTPTVTGTSHTFGPLDDTDGEACGATFETTIVVSTDAGNGNEARIFVNDTPRVTTTVSGSAARFEGVAFDNRGDTPNTVTVEVFNDDGVSCRQDFPVPVFLDCEGVSCAITSPDTASGFLNQGDDVSDEAGFQGNFEVTTDMDGAGQAIRLVVDGNETSAPSAQPDGMVATFGNVTLSEGVHRVRAICSDAAGNITSSGESEWTVDISPCDVGLSAPSEGELFIDADDVNDALDGLQINATGTAGADCTGLRVGLCSALDTMTFGAASASWTAEATLASSATQELCVQSEDAAGNVGESRVAIRVNTAAPQVEIGSPLTGAAFNIAGTTGRTMDLMSGNTTCEAVFDVYCTAVDVPVTLALEATMAQLGTANCVADATVPSGYAGRAAFPMLSLPSVEDGMAIAVIARQESDRLVGISAPISIQSDCVAPGPFISRPLCGSVLRPSTDDADPIADGFQYGTNVQNPTDPTADVVLTIGGGSPLTNSMSVTTAIFPSVTYPGGLVSVEASVTDSAGNIGISPACSVRVEDLPTLSITAPAEGGVLSLTEDCDSGAVGFQMQVTATTDSVDDSMATVQFGTDTPIATTVTGNTISVCADAPEGSVLIQVGVSDIRGSSSANVTVTVDTLPPTAAISDLSAAISDRRGGIARFSWTSVADDGGGNLDSYQLRCAMTAITDEAGWASATAHVITQEPGVSGAGESDDVNGFRPGETRHCVLRGADVAGALTPLPAASVSISNDLLSTVVTSPGGMFFGFNVAPVGDVTGDGIDDFVIGAGGGHAYLYFGSASPLSTTVAVNIGGATGALGARVAGLGDFNGDGIGDIVFGGPGTGAGRGQVSVLFGRPEAMWLAGSFATPAYNLAGCGAMGAVCFTTDDGVGGSGPDEAARFGFSVAPAGDFDGDGLMDLIAGAPGANGGVGRAYVIRGTSALTGAQNVLDGSVQGWVIDDTSGANEFGNGVGSVGGDMTGDGRAEVLIARLGGGGTDGAGFALLGRAFAGSGLVAIAEAELQMLGSGEGGTYGLVMSGLGDVNGDGFLDAGAADQNAGGHLFIYLGGATGFSSPTTIMANNDLSAATSDAMGFTIGQGLHPWLGRIGDLDGDGLTDLLSGSIQTGTDGGSTDLFYRDNSTTSFGRSDASFSLGGATAASRPNYVGDINGDGQPDFAIGNPAGGQIQLHY